MTLNSQVPQDPIEAARLANEAFEPGGNPLWAMPLIEYLESRLPGAALVWAIQLVSSFEAEGSRESFSQRQTWLGWLKTTNLTAIDAAELFARAQKIRSASGDGDRYRAAISKLYEAAAFEVEERHDEYRHAVQSAVSLLAERQPDSGISLILQSFLDWSHADLKTAGPAS